MQRWLRKGKEMGGHLPRGRAWPKLVRIRHVNLFFAMVFSLVGAASVAIFAAWVLAPLLNVSTQPTPPADLTRLALTVAAGVGGVVALVVAYRRQRDLEQGRFVEEFGAAAKQLGDADVAVRLAGVYAMAGVADQNSELKRQQCIDVLCGYLRLPYSPELGNNHQVALSVKLNAPTVSDPEEELQFQYRQNDKVVRQTIVRVIAAHLQEKAPHSWSSNDFDFTGSHFEQANFYKGVFSGGRTSFKGATFSGRSTSFKYVTFSGGRTSFKGATFSGGSTSFECATFSGGVTSFEYATFSGNEISFHDATFIGGVALFEYATFSGKISFKGAFFGRGNITFDHATFSGEGAGFHDATFSGGRTLFTEVDFGGEITSFYAATFSGKIAEFNGATFSSVSTLFNKAAFSGESTSLLEVTFSGESTSFLEVTFSAGRTSLSEVDFGGKSTTFQKATFSSEITLFEGATFRGTSTSFVLAAFCGRASFRGVDFGAGAVTFERPRAWSPAPVFDWDEANTPVLLKPANVEPQDWPPHVAKERL